MISLDEVQYMRLPAVRDAIEEVKRTGRELLRDDPNQVTDATAEMKAVASALEDRRAALEYIERLAGDPSHHEPIGDGIGMLAASPTGPTADVRSRALRAVDRQRGILPGRAGDRLEAVIRDTRNDPFAIGARYLEAISSPDYNRAFGKLLANPTYAHLDMTPAEQAAVRAVREVMQQRALAIDPGSAGGFAVPFAIDPSVINTSDGAINPLRALAKVKTIATSTWKGISSEGVEATYEAEGSEVGEDDIDFAQPEAVTEKAHTWVKFSIELGMDWGSLQSELAQLMADAKDVLEADAFVNGLGHISFEPEGILAGLPGSSFVGSTFDLAGLYALQAALPPRYQGRARFLMNLADINEARRFVASADATEPQILVGDTLLRKPLAELSTLPNDSVLYGDVGATFTIVDRIGLAVELVPHVFGSSQRPTGERGLYAYWRNSSVVVNGNGMRAIGSSSGS